MLEFEVVPEFALRNSELKFLLGMPFNQAVQFIQENCTIKGVQILYSDLTPLSMDLVINLSEDGIRLIFDSYMQRLKLIEIYNLRLLKLKYSTKCFCSLETKPTLEKIDNVFGPTLPGIYDPSQQIFVLNFCGLSFSFPIDSHLQPNYSNGMGSLQFLDGQAPVVSKMCIYSGNDIDNIKCPPISPISFEGGAYLEDIEVLIYKGLNIAYGIKVTYSTENFHGTQSHNGVNKSVFERILLFDHTAQEVNSALGIPEKIFYKSEDRMKIHKPKGTTTDTGSISNCVYTDYFYNYFDLGLDILFDGMSHKVIKFVLHANFPGHYDFTTYARANFRIPFTLPDPEQSGRPLINEASYAMVLDDTTNPLSSGQGGPTAYGQGEGTAFVTPFTKWDTIQELLTLPTSQQGKPLVLNRTSSTNSVNPFGSTYCYAFQNTIFEVMPNNHIATVTLFMPHL